MRDDSNVKVTEFYRSMGWRVGGQGGGVGAGRGWEESNDEERLRTPAGMAECALGGVLIDGGPRGDGSPGLI